MQSEWELMATDSVSGRQIFKKDVPNDPGFGHDTGTQDFFVTADFEVRSKDGSVLLRTSGSSRGEYWCGVFLWFVEGSNGTQVKIERSDNKDDRVFEVPDNPIEESKVK